MSTSTSTSASTLASSSSPLLPDAAPVARIALTGGSSHTLMLLSFEAVARRVPRAHICSALIQSLWAPSTRCDTTQSPT